MCTSDTSDIDRSGKRKKHSHRCPTCHHAVYCYRGECKLPQRTECAGCRWRRAQAQPAALRPFEPFK